MKNNSGLKSLFLFLCFFGAAGQVRAQELTSENKQKVKVGREHALWEYGLGIGYIKYEHYPASNQYSHITVPVPTFQYRGKIFRADDQEGARAYIMKNENYSFEFSGTFNPPLKSDSNEARQGMDDLPALIALGPQLVFKLPQQWNFKLGWFGALATNFSTFTYPGYVAEVRLDRIWSKDLSSWREDSKLLGRFIISYKIGSEDFNSLYYSVEPGDVTPSRTPYRARFGPLSLEYSYFQSIEMGRVGLYLGASYSDYSFSANRESSLYKADNSFTSFIGLTYVLGESQQSSVPLNETEGMVNRMRSRRTDPL